MVLAFVLVIFGFWAHAAPAADFTVMEGHGGPVMGVAVSPETGAQLTASFDNAVGYWRSGKAPLWLEGHEAAVKTVIFTRPGEAASAGDDHSIILWDLETGAIRHRLEGHRGQVVDLAVEGDLLASASWDGRIGIWNLETGNLIRWIEGHRSNVNAVAFSNEGDNLYSASTDGTIRHWDLQTGYERILVRHGFGVNRLIADEAAGWLAYGALDGGTRVIALGSGRVLADLTLERRPILAMAVSPDGGQMAVGDGEGYIMVVATADWSIARDFHAALNGPIWALAYTADGTGLIAGGIDDAAFVWPVALDGDLPKMGAEKRAFHTDPATVSNGERQFLRKCSVCHDLDAAPKVRRAGPTLANLFGRPAGAVAGYLYSDAVAESGIIWTAETIDQLFDLGPAHFIPGTKMPMQRIALAQDRRDLIEFLMQYTIR